MVERSQFLDTKELTEQKKISFNERKIMKIFELEKTKKFELKQKYQLKKDVHSY